MADEAPQNVNDIYVRLWQKSRQGFVPEEAMDVTTREGLDQAREIVQKAVDGGLTNQAKLSRRTGIKPSSLSQFLSGDTAKWNKGTLATTASTLARAVNQLMVEKEAEQTQLGGFVSTRLAEEVFGLAHRAIARRQMAAFIMHAGLGKTMALQALLQEYPGSVLITVTAARSTPRSYLQLWCREFRLKESGRIAELQDRIGAFVKGTSRAVFIDEAHKLTTQALDVTREIWDLARIPVIFAGTPSLHQHMTARPVGTDASELMDQLSSRVSMFRNLTYIEDADTGAKQPCVTVEDIRKVYCRAKLRIAADGVDFLYKLANAPGAGGLRVCGSLVQLAVDLWPDTTITAEMLIKCLNTRMGVHEAGFVVDTIEATYKKAAAG